MKLYTLSSMAYFPCYKVVLIFAFVITLLLRSSSSSSSELRTDFYDNTCQRLVETVHRVLKDAIDKETRMGASILRLHFHDCFVQGCDGSILLDNTTAQNGEKFAFPNINSVRGFDVIDKIKKAVEDVCPNTVSCADILTIAARESVILLGGPYWKLYFGRRDSKTANRTAANIDIPSPFSNLSVLISNFKSKGLSVTDLVALSGAHTVGVAKCSSFKQHIYNDKNIDNNFAQQLRRNCPNNSTKNDNNLAPLDTITQEIFDNKYYADLILKQGLLNSDQQLFNKEGQAAWRVRKYNTHPDDFFTDFAKAMINMAGISPLTGTNGEIRKNCWKVNGRNNK